ncbi:MAG: BspA family leucine-rich repeat surface protein, partial [Lactobacillus crispatus]
MRKYTIGLCSVCLGFVTIGMGSQTVKADTINNVEKSSAVQENKMQDADPANTTVSTEAKANTPDSATAKPKITPTEIKENEIGSVATTAPKTNTTSNGVKANTTDSATSTETKPTEANSTLANSNLASAQSQSAKAELVVQPKVNATSTEAKPNELGSAVVKPNVTSKGAKPNVADLATLTEIKPQEIKLAKQVDVKTLAESKVAIDNQFNFDDWNTQIDNNYLNITGYKGDRSKQIVVPNGADFAKAGKNDKNLQVEIDQDTLAALIVDGVAPKLSNTDGQKIVAKGSDWFYAFYGKHLHDISGLANLDTSNVTNMGCMFEHNQISDLSPLANWNTGKVTEMHYMFDHNQISD